MVPWLFVYGVGVGMATAQLSGVILADVPVAARAVVDATRTVSFTAGAFIVVGLVATAPLPPIRPEAPGAPGGVVPPA